MFAFFLSLHAAAPLVLLSLYSSLTAQHTSQVVKLMLVFISTSSSHQSSFPFISGISSSAGWRMKILHPIYTSQSWASQVSPFVAFYTQYWISFFTTSTYSHLPYLIVRKSSCTPPNIFRSLLINLHIVTPMGPPLWPLLSPCPPDEYCGPTPTPVPNSWCSCFNHCTWFRNDIISHNGCQ